MNAEPPGHRHNRPTPTPSRRMEKTILVLLATGMILLLVSTGHSSPGFDTRIRSACIKLGTDVNYDLDLEDCATCHDRGHIIENRGNPFWDAYHADDWTGLCEPPENGWPQATHPQTPPPINDPIGLPPPRSHPPTRQDP